MGVTLSPLWLGEFLKNVGPDFGPEGVESEEVSGLPLEEVELSEQPSQGVLGKGSEWKEHVVVRGTPVFHMSESFHDDPRGCEGDRKFLHPA